eukprot:4436374-Pleurochrysis_carterae.AAC.1
MRRGRGAAPPQVATPMLLCVRAKYLAHPAILVKVRVDPLNGQMTSNKTATLEGVDRRDG